MKRKIFAILLLIVVSFLITNNKADSKDFEIINKIDFNKKNPKITQKYRDIIWDLIVKDLPDKFHNMTEKEIQKYFGDTFSKEQIYVETADINQDNQNEIFYVFGSTANCGTAGCGIFQLIKEKEGNYKGKYLFHNPPAPIYILKTKTDGYNDLLVSLKYFKKEGGSDFKYRLLKHSLKNDCYLMTKENINFEGF